jgi:hypothetical protein
MRKPSQTVAGDIDRGRVVLRLLVEPQCALGALGPAHQRDCLRHGYFLFGLTFNASQRDGPQRPQEAHSAHIVPLGNPNELKEEDAALRILQSAYQPLKSITPGGHVVRNKREYIPPALNANLGSLLGGRLLWCVELRRVTKTRWKKRKASEKKRAQEIHENIRSTVKALMRQAH